MLTKIKSSTFIRFLPVRRALSPEAVLYYRRDTDYKRKDFQIRG
jgi:hypothetical protein